MQTCENCGTDFDQPDDVVEVTSLRILCPSCTAERAAAKAKKAAQKTAAPSTPAAGAKPARPAALQASAPAHAPESAPPRARPTVLNDKPAAAAPQRATPAPAPAKAPATAKAAATAAHKPAHAPMPAKKVVPGNEETAVRARASAAKPKKVEIELASKELKKSGSRETWVAFGVAFVIFVVAGLVAWKVLGQKKAESDAAQAYKDKVENFRTAFMGMNIETEDGAKALIVLCDDPDNKKLWNAADFAADVVSREAKAKTFLESQEKRRELLAQADAIEAKMGKASELPPSELAEGRRQLDELAAKADIVGAEFVARVAKDRLEGERVYLERLESAAQEAAKTEPLDRAALTTIQQSEDEFLKAFETAFKAFQKNAKDAAVVAKKDELQKRYQALLVLSDQAVTRFFTPEVIDAAPWRDLLSADGAGAWKAANVKGFEHRIDGGVLQIVRDSAEKGEAIMSVGDKEIWRDFEIEAEVTLVKGSCTLFFRLPLVYQENVEHRDLLTDEGQLEAGRTYTFTFRVLGSIYQEVDKTEDANATPTSRAISWTQVRKGAFGISIPRDTEIKFTKLRAKVLR